MIVKNPSFITSAVKPFQYPDTGLPEIAFCGRSNVGKSSLINSLLGRKSLARSGSRQGMTRLVNFFNVDDVLTFVDLPGYGYAAVSKEEKDKWGNIVESYLKKRTMLSLIILLVDIRHKPTADDVQMMNWIKAMNLKYIVVATKADKLVKTAIPQYIKVIKESLETEEIIPVSTVNRSGIDKLWEVIDNYMAL